jgi:hypothetical protein
LLLWPGWGLGLASSTNQVRLWGAAEHFDRTFPGRSPQLQDRRDPRGGGQRTGHGSVASAGARGGRRCDGRSSARATPGFIAPVQREPGAVVRDGRSSHQLPAFSLRRSQPPVKPSPVPLPPRPRKPFAPPVEDDPAAPRVYWAGPSRPSWSRFGQDLTKLVAQSAPDIFVVTYTEPGLGPVKFGHVVVQGQDLRIGPGQPLVLIDPVDPSTWRVGPRKRRTQHNSPLSLAGRVSCSPGGGKPSGPGGTRLRQRPNCPHGRRN